MTTSLVLASYSEVEGSGQIASRCTKLAAKEEIRQYLHCTVKKKRDLITDNDNTMTSITITMTCDV